jgi:hypothetical protein
MIIRCTVLALAVVTGIGAASGQAQIIEGPGRQETSTLA